ncbi:GNAT family N-acetyltransferase [Halobacillus kuroshimensis]|uniref:GNAT family N-acetyltransferase n=1 Tax=Halobacillus kuroshimensis TaxID=302481 RepID=A0ABS3DRP5_9BACI|nr:GNAT family N-acetyltransferase [Halobacillus kuroshimensis]MBN8234001.1 GNAT family N-acetyltransferase [Halobacillus kuroshimensis]
MNEESNAVLESQRCYVRPFIQEDLEAFMNYRNDLDWMKYQGFKGYTREVYETTLLNSQRVEEGSQLAVIRKKDQVLLGDVFLLQKEDDFWIGYTIDPSYKRQGYAYEVVHDLIHWIQSKGDYMIKAGVEKENLPSINLLEKSGFRRMEEEDDEFVYVWNGG